MTDFHSAVVVIHILFDLRHFVLVANLNILGSSQLADSAAGAGYKVIAQGKAGGLHGVTILDKGGAGAERIRLRFQILGKGGGGEAGAAAHIILARVSNGCQVEAVGGHIGVCLDGIKGGVGIADGVGVVVARVGHVKDLVGGVGVIPLGIGNGDAAGGFCCKGGHSQSQRHGQGQQNPEKLSHRFHRAYPF